MDTLNQQINFDKTILSNSTLLYLENNEEIRKETLSVFEKFFKQVFVGTDGRQGLDLYNTNKDQIDVILTEINMPNMDGIEFMSEVRKEDSTLPILIVTAFNDINVLVKVIKLNVTDYIVKPILIKSTLKILSRILTDRYNQKLVDKQQNELQIYKEILDKENLVSETDLKGIITYANDIFCEISGYRKEELIGQNHNIVRHPDISPKIYENMWNTIQNKKVWKGKIKNSTKDGTTYYVKSTVFPILDEDGNIEKYVASRFLITEDEEEKHKLKRYIMHQKSEQLKHEKQLREEFDDAVHYEKMKKDEQIAKFVHELNGQVKTLRSKNNDDKGRIISLEKKLKEALSKNDDLQIGYQKRIEKLHKSAVVAIEEYHKIKKKNDIVSEKYKKTQEGVVTLQTYIDEYREKIKNLEDVISAYEKEFGKLSNISK